MMRKSEPPLDPDDLVKFDALLGPEADERRRIIRDELNISTGTFRLHLRAAASDPDVQAEYPDATRRILHRLNLDELRKG
jgi:hypothetical protein